MYRYATGHSERPSESSALYALEDAFADDGYRVTELLVDIATSDAFRLVAPPSTEPPATPEDEVSE
jgi:hypothetical protein